MNKKPRCSPDRLGQPCSRRLRACPPDAPWSGT